MKYTILGFQQDKLIENNLSVEDAFILRIIKDMYSSASMEFKDFEGIKYMWINYSYLLEQIPIIGSKRNLMRRIEFYGKECLLLRILEKERNGVKGNYSYISPTEKLDLLQDFDLMTESHKVVTKSHKPYDKNGIGLMTESHNKDTSIKDTSIKDTSINEVWKYYSEKLKTIGKTRKKTENKIKHIHARLEEFTVEQLKQVIDNVFSNEWMLGENPKNKMYIEIENFMCNTEKVEKWLDTNSNLNTSHKVDIKKTAEIINEPPANIKDWED